MNTPFLHSRGGLIRSFASLLLLLFLPGFCHAFDWDISTLERGKWFDHMGSRSLVLDSSDRPQIAYGGRDLYNAWYDGSKWQTMVVDTGPGVGRRAAIALPPGSGSTCIGYTDEPNGHVKCAQWVSANFFPFMAHWRIETVADAAMDRSVTVATSNLGEPRLLFFSASGQLRYAYRENNLWYFETVYLNSTGDTQNYADMKIDSSGRVHVVFSRKNQPLTYARRELSGTWTQSNFGLAAYVDAYPALALDAAERPHVVYARNQLPSDATSSYLVYTHFDGAAWQQEAIAASETRTVASDISAVMRNGTLHVSYFDPDAKNLAYVNVTTGTSQTVDSGTNAGWHCSIAVTASGGPVISYYDKEELKFGSFGTPAWSVKTLDKARSAPAGFSLAAEASGAMHATWVETYEHHLRYARQNGTNWQVTSVADGATPDTSLKLTSNGYPRIAFYSGIFNALRYSSFLTGGISSYWKTETIDTGGGSDNSLALNSEDWPWISYDAGGDLKCAYQNTNGWNLLTVDNTTGQYIFGTSIAFAPNGLPSIAYARLGVLMWAYSHWYHRSLVWDKEIVTTNYDETVQPTLIYNADGLPCIGFVEDVRGPRFAWRDGTGWHVQDLDTSQYSSSCAYAMDEAGRHYLVYKSDKDDFIRHAFGYGDLTNLTWRVQMIHASQSFLNHGVSLIVRDSQPHMVFSGSQYSGRDVLYARGLPLRITNIARKGGSLEIQWSGETNGVELQSRSKVDTTRWAVKAHNLSGTNYSISATNPAAFHRLRLE